MASGMMLRCTAFNVAAVLPVSRSSSLTSRLQPLIFRSRATYLHSSSSTLPLADTQMSNFNYGRSRSHRSLGHGIRSQAEDFNSKKQTVKNSKKGSLAHLELESTRDVKRKTSFNGIFSLLLLNLVAFVADHMLQLRFMKMLYLYHDYPRWYQFITSTFCHVSWSHLSSNLFFLYIFGKLVEEEEGSFAVWLSYLFTGVGANVVSWLILPRSVVSVGASGAVFGLFAISVLVKLSFDWRKILEVLILGQFVVEKVMEAAQASTQLAGRTYVGAANINHIAHLSGALVGVVLIWLLNRIPSLGDDSTKK